MKNTNKLLDVSRMEEQAKSSCRIEEKRFLSYVWLNQKYTITNHY